MPQNIPGAAVLTSGNKVLLCCNDSDDDDSFDGDGN